MKQILFQPELHKFNTCREFTTEFSIGKGDLIITTESCYHKYMEPLNLEVDVIYPRHYGKGEPDDAMVKAMYHEVENMPPHKRIIGIGGGTVLDITKLFALKQMMPLEDLFDHKIKPEKEKELILIPTTCGTGSEVTNISIVSFLDRNSKLGLAEAELFADYAVLIPELISDLPYHYFATSSIDALIHAIESSLSPKATTYTRLFSYKAIEMLLHGYLGIAKKGQECYQQYLEDFLLAADYAGLAFGTAGCATVHAMSYPLSGTFHVAHGEANYLFLTAVLKYYSKLGGNGSLAELVNTLSALLDCKKENVFDTLSDLLVHILPKRSLSYYGTTIDMLPVWAESVIQNQQRLLKNSYVPMTEADLMEIYMELL